MSPFPRGTLQRNSIVRKYLKMDSNPRLLPYGLHVLNLGKVAKEQPLPNQRNYSPRVKCLEIHRSQTVVTKNTDMEICISLLPQSQGSKKIRKQK